MRSAERLPVPEPLPLPASMRAAAPKSPPAAAPEAQPATARVATLERPAPPLTVSRERSAPSPTLTRERPAPQPIVARAIEVIPEPIEDEATERVGLAVRVAQLPRVLLDTVAWGGFAAVVALIVIALSDVGMGRAALWALGLSGIVVLAVAVMAVTGTHLDELNRAPGTTERPD